MNLSYLVGGNIGFFLYQGMKTTMHWYIALPLSFGAYFLSRNLILRNCMDRIYYSLEPIYLKLRGKDDAKKLKDLEKQYESEDKDKLRNDKI